jgi:hypothetical protein
MNRLCKRGISVAFATLAVSVSSFGQKDPPQSSSVTFEFVDNRGGAPLSGRFVIDSSNGRVYDAKVTQEVTVRLPYGKYLILYEDAIYSPVSREVKVDQPEAFFVVSEPLNNFVSDVTDGTPSAISVRVQPIKTCSPGGALWAKLVGVYSVYSAERKIGPNGFALFDGIDDGQYLLMIVDGTQIRATQPVRTDRKVTTVSVTPQDCK